MEEQFEDMGTVAQHDAEAAVSSTYQTQVNTTYTVAEDVPQFDKLSLEDSGDRGGTDQTIEEELDPFYPDQGSTGYPSYRDYPASPDTSTPAYTSQSASTNPMHSYGGVYFTASNQPEPTYAESPPVGDPNHSANSATENSGYGSASSNQAAGWQSAQQTSQDSYYVDPDMSADTNTRSGKHPAETHSKRQDRTRSSGQSTSRHEGKNSVPHSSKPSRQEYKANSSHKRVASHDSKSTGTKSKSSKHQQTTKYSQSAIPTASQQPRSEYGEYRGDDYYSYGVSDGYPPAGQYYNTADQTYNTSQSVYPATSGQVYPDETYTSSEPVYPTSGQVYPGDEGSEQQPHSYSVGDAGEWDYGNGRS